MTPRLIAILVGTPKTYGHPDAPDPMDREWTTSFFKEPVSGPVRVHRTHVEGDRSADARNHGGPEQAVLAYSADHYPEWRRELGREDFSYGAFAENFTVTELNEETVCVGDVYSVGDVTLQVSKPRAPCWKISRRWRLEDLTRRVATTGRTGWYHRVLEPGQVEAGQRVTLMQRPCPEWSISRVAGVIRDRHARRDEALALSACESLAPDWRAILQKG